MHTWIKTTSGKVINVAHIACFEVDNNCLIAVLSLPPNTERETLAVFDYGIHAYSKELTHARGRARLLLSSLLEAIEKGGIIEMESFL